jgi:phenylacetate-CoA ligase
MKMDDLSVPRDPESAAQVDYLSRDRLTALQVERLQRVVQLAYDQVELSRARLTDSGMLPQQIVGLDDLSRLPFTVKQDLRDTYPYGMLACPMAEVRRIHASSGTTGTPIVVPYTDRDLKVWTSAMVRTLHAYGIHAKDVIQNAYGYGLFTGGLGVHYGGEQLGATMVPTSSGSTDRQILVLKEFGVTIICCTPSYFLHLLDRAEDLGVDLRELPLRAGVFGAEPWTEAMRKRVEQSAGIKAFDIYGLSEIVGPGVAAECEQQDGLHIFEDHFLPEVIDPESGEVLPDGEEGELVLTTLSKEAMPLIRYRTGDITTIIPGTCPCGRVLRRIRRISRRTDDMMIIRGVNVYPSQIESALLAVDGTLPHYQIELSRNEDLDQVAVHVEIDGDSDASANGRLHGLVTDALKRVVGLRMEVKLLAPQTLPRSEGKAQRVVDKRPV